MRGILEVQPLEYLSSIIRRKSAGRTDVLRVLAGENTATVIGIATSIMLARELNASGTGQLSAAIATVSVLAAVATLGVPQSYSLLSSRQTHQESRYFLAALEILILSSIAFSLVGIFALARLSSDWLPLALVLMPVYFPSVVLRPIFRNREYVRGAVEGMALIPIAAASTQGLITTCLSATGLLTVHSAFVAFALSALVRTLLTARVFWRSQRSPSKTQLPKGNSVHRTLLRAGPSYLMLNGGLILQQQIPILAMAFLGAPPDRIGVLSRVLQLTGIPLLALQGLQPLIFHRWLRRDLENVATDMRRLAVLSGAIFVPLAILAAFIGPMVLSAVYGCGFETSAVAMVICQLAAYPALMLSASAHALSAKERNTKATIALAMSALFAVTVYFLLAHVGGVGLDEVLSMSLAILVGNTAGALMSAKALATRG